MLFSWDIHWACNYRCPYCFHHGKWDEMSQSNYYPGIGRLVDAWTDLHRKYGTCTLQIAGGEPFSYPGFADLVVVINALHRLSIVTNLSCDPQTLADLIGGVTRKKNIEFKVSFHPHHADPVSFIRKLEFLRKNDIPVAGISVVGWPPLQNDIPRYREVFGSAGFILQVQDFWGEHEGKEYVSPEISMGRQCLAGHSYAIIKPNGDVLRCGGRGYEGKESALGNIFTGEPGLFPAPQPCDMKHCRCGQFRSFALGDLPNGPDSRARDRSG